ncbi:MAG: protoporphyrinogen oxidase [Planctomycetota bacterium]|nr:protoporphyrinogen oxidase [Planctomycetota bacterium]
MTDTVVDTLVVGTGMSGLAHAFWRAKAGDTVCVIDAADRVGGVLETVHVGPYRIERAATSVPSSASHLFALHEALAEPPAMHPALPAAKAQYLLGKTGLRRVPRSPPTLFTTPMLTMGQRIRAMAEPFMPKRRIMNNQRTETLSGFVTRRFGRAITENFLRPFTNGVYGASPDKLGAADAFPQLTAMEQRHGSVVKGLIKKMGESKASGKKRGKREIRMFEEGTEAFPKAIAAELGDAVRLGTAVATIEPGDDERPATVVLANGDRIAAQELVLAIPARAQATLLGPIAPEIADLLNAVPYVAIAVAAVGFEASRGPKVPDAFGFLRGRGSKARILGATLNSRLSPHVAPEGHELMTIYFGGSEDPGFLDESDAEIRRQVLADLADALGGRIHPDVFDIYRWPRGIPLFAPGHRGRMAWAQSQLSERRIRLLGSHVTGVGLDSCCAPLAPLRAPLPPAVARV